MELEAGTRLLPLLDQYPYLLDFLIEINPHFNNFKNPVMRETMGKSATLALAAQVAGLPVDDLIGRLKAKIQAETSGSGPAETPAAADPQARREALKGIIRDLHDGAKADDLKDRFRGVIKGVDAGEVARMEQELMNEGLPAEEIKRLCDVHVSIFQEALEAQDRPEAPPGHPVHTYMKENRYLEDLAAGLSRVIGLIKVAIDAPDRAGPLMEYRRLLDDLARLDQRYARKENQLFPMLEAHHFTGPSQVMWAIHDDIRAKIRAAREKLDAGDGPGSMAEVLDVLGPIREMIYKEEHILFPACLEMLSEAEWKKIQAGDEEIGFPWMTPDEGWPGVASAPAAEPEVYGAPAVEAVPAGPIPDLLPLKTGRLTLEQIDLIFRHLPVDITFVDENDRVAYYSDGDRIFPRSPAIIGREVRNCHPPKSVHVVNRILDDFKSGARDSAAFWIQLKGKFIYIRYFAVHDEKGRYKGCLEVSQEVSDIKALEGQKRLLD